MRKYFINIFMFISIHTTALAHELSFSQVDEFDTRYLEKIELTTSVLKGSSDIAIDVNSLEDNSYEVKVGVNEFFRPFVIIGSKITEFLNSFSFSSIGQGFGANLCIGDSFNYYAKYMSNTFGTNGFSRLESSSLQIGLEYSF